MSRTKLIKSKVCSARSFTSFPSLSFLFSSWQLSLISKLVTTFPLINLSVHSLFSHSFSARWSKLYRHGPLFLMFCNNLMWHLTTNSLFLFSPGSLCLFVIFLHRNVEVERRWDSSIARSAHTSCFDKTPFGMTDSQANKANIQCRKMFILSLFLYPYGDGLMHAGIRL